MGFMNFLNSVGSGIEHMGSDIAHSNTPIGHIIQAIRGGQTPPAQTPQQAQAAMMGDGYNHLSPQDKAQLDRRAQAAGYPSYAAMKMHEMQMRQGSTQVGNGQTDTPGQVWDNAMAWHPRKIFDYVNNAYGDATGQ